MTLIQITDTEACRVCDDIIIWDDINFRNRDGIAICDSCHSDKYYKCEWCDVSVYPENWNNYTDMCQRCTNDRYTYCVDCNDITHNDYVYWTQCDSEARCESCHDDHCCEGCEDDSSRVPNVVGYHEGAPWDIQFHHINGRSDDPGGLTYYGVELECEYVSPSIGDTIGELMSARIGHAETDGSLNDGIEFITQPATLMAWRDSFGDSVREYMTSVQQFGGTFEAKSCGAHVHVSRTVFGNDTHLFRFVTFMRHNESFIRAISGREGSSIDRWAKVNAYRRGELRQEVKRQCGDRYRAVNLNNASTIEIRFMAGSNNFADILGIIELLSAIIEYVRDLTISDSNIGGMFAHSFVTWLMDAELCDYDHARNLVVARYGIPD